MAQRIRTQRDPTEILVHADDLSDGDGVAFRRVADAALADLPSTLLIHLVAGRQLRLAGVTTLLQTRRKARAQGTRFFVRTSNRAIIGHLKSLGLTRVLAQAA